MKNNEQNSKAYTELINSLDLDDSRNAYNETVENNEIAILKSPNEENMNKDFDEENSERTFTQKEVNEIVKKRLSRKEKNINEEVDKRVSDELEKRSNDLDCKEYLIENGYPKDFMEIFENENIDDFKIKVGKVMALIQANKKEIVPPLKNPEIGRFSDDEYAKGFSVKEHVPKKLY